MSGLADVFSEQERTNWLKACLGLNIAKHALEQFVDKEVKDVQIRIFQSVRSRLNLPAATICTNCSTANLLKCPTLNVCKKRGKHVCRSMHDTVAKQPRPCNIRMCDEIRDGIIKEHRYDQPSWKNTSAEQWASNHWEIAKCFLPPDGYIGVGSAQGTDFNGIISVMLNCKHFDSKVSFTVAQPGSSCQLSKAREIGRAVRHNSDCKMNNNDLQNAFSTLIGLLSDPTCLGQDGHAQEAIRKIKQLQVDCLKITEAEMSQLLKNAQDTLNEMKQVADESMKEMKAFVENFYKKYAALEDEDYERVAVKDFVRRLKQHYSVTLGKVSISTLFPSSDESLYQLYAAPSIYRIVENKDRDKSEQEVTAYSHIFYTENNEKLNKRIVLQGEAGMGKSTFASKLVLDWCNSGEALPTRSFVDTNTLQKFTIVLMITLRDSDCEREVTKMIKEQLIDMVYADTERNDAYEMLNTMMQKEICLVVQDGLDEWKDPQGKLAQPIMASCYSQCTVFTTTRPWKLTDERIRKSQFDSLFELKGVSEPYMLCEKVLYSLGCETPDEFTDYVREKKLDDLLFVANVAVANYMFMARRNTINTLAVRGIRCFNRRTFKKASDAQSYFVEPPFRCLQNTRYFQQHLEHLQAISKTAFSMMFSAEREHSLVISDQVLSRYLTQQQKDFALKTGILSERMFSCRTYQRSTCSFIHKSVQEFLAALYIAGNNADLGVVSRYMTETTDAIFETNIFIFLCGLNISAANALSRTIDSSIDNEDKLFSITNVYIHGFIEAQANVQNPNDIDLKLSRIVYNSQYFDEYFNEYFAKKAFFSIMQMNNSNAKLLDLTELMDEDEETLACLPETLMCKDEGVCRLDLSSFRNLENLYTSELLSKTSIQLEKLKFLNCIVSVMCWTCRFILIWRV